MIDNSIYWFLGTTIFLFLGFIISVSIVNLNLPPEKRTVRLRKIGLIWFGIFLFSVPFFKPYVSSFSYAGYIEETRIENLDSAEKIVENQNKQTDDIIALKKDVIELKKDLSNVNRYYSSILQFLSSLFGILCFSMAFRNPDNNSGESQTDQFLKL